MKTSSFRGEGSNLQHSAPKADVLPIELPRKAGARHEHKRGAQGAVEAGPSGRGETGRRPGSPSLTERCRARRRGRPVRRPAGAGRDRPSPAARAHLHERNSLRLPGRRPEGAKLLFSTGCEEVLSSRESRQRETAASSARSRGPPARRACCFAPPPCRGCRPIWPFAQAVEQAAVDRAGRLFGSCFERAARPDGALKVEAHERQRTIQDRR